MDSKQWDDRYREKGLLWSEGPNRFLEDAVKDLSPGRALVLACGEGRNALWLAGRGWQVAASDFSPVAIDKARARASKLGVDVSFSVADVKEPVTGVFDLVLLFYLQVPRDTLADALATGAAALADGGTLLVVGHDTRNLAEGYGGPQHPSVLYGPDDVVALLPQLRIVRAETIERPVQTAEGTRIALDVLVRATRGSDAVATTCPATSS